LPKIITTLFFLSTLLVFFDVTRRFIGATGASLFTLLLMITPEYFSHAALALGNLPTTAYVCAGALCTIAWLEKREEKFFWLGAILMGFAVWVRGDTIVFTAAALLVMGIDFLRTKDWKKTVIYGAIVTAPFIIWALYLKFKIKNVPSAKFDFSIGFNSERWEVVKGYTDAYLFGGDDGYKGLGNVDGAQFYGLAFVLFFAVLLANILLLAVLFYRKANWKQAILSQTNILLLFFASFVAYFLLFYF
ncbi:MAG: glycosyltransferase family 39 protein, partial [Bacteroidota bacterium]